MFQWLDLYIDTINICCEKIVIQDEQIPLDTIDKINIHITKIEQYTNMNANKFKEIIPAAMNEVTSFDKTIDEIRLNQRNQIFLKNIITIFEDNKPQ